MKIKLDECRHRSTETTKHGYTCLGCFKRLDRVFDDDSRSRVWIPAIPWDGQCLHLTSFLKPLDAKGSSMHRAICANCGCIVEHPPGEGKWTPALFYGLVIHEELW